ncbi:MAG: S8 family peptidase [Acidimicrobiales bacterium]
MDDVEEGDRGLEGGDGSKGGDGEPPEGGDAGDDGNGRGEGDEPTNGGTYDRTLRVPLPGPTGPWTHRMGLAPTVDGLPYPYRPHDVLTTEGRAALEIARRVFPDAELTLDDATVGPPEMEFFRLTGVPDPFLLIDALKGRGIQAQVNHVYFTHSLQGNPVYGSPVYGSPVYGSPVYGSPVYGSPVYGSPVYGSAAQGGGAAAPQVVGFGIPPQPNIPYGTEVFGRKSDNSVHPEPNRSSALPKPPRTQPDHLHDRIHTPERPDSPEVFVLDTGLAADFFCPDAIQGTGIRPATPQDVDQPSAHVSNQGYLEPAAGHGTFIAGVITQIAPGCRVTVHAVLSTFGDGDEWVLADRINHLNPVDPGRAILNCSFGGYVLDAPLLMTTTIRHIQRSGVQVVASAGNDATSTPSYPAALPGVLAVGALSPTGPAYFTNYGPWVEACAPGYDLLSTFFRNFNGPAPVGPYGEDPDDFDGWAVWSGTSFAGPVVVGNLARLLMHDGGDTKQALDRLINNFSLTVIPNLGTIVDFM